jgi:hypothetical protein
VDYASWPSSSECSNLTKITGQIVVKSGCVDVATESLDTDQVAPAIADSVYRQRTIRARRRALERKATQLGMVE